MDEVVWTGSNMAEVQQFLSNFPNYHAHFVGRMNAVRLTLMGPEGDRTVDLYRRLRWDGSQVVIGG